MDTTKLHEVIESSKGLNPRDFRLAVELALSELFPYNMSEEDELLSCGLSAEGYKTAVNLLEEQESPESHPETVKAIETCLTKRELSNTIVALQSDLSVIHRHPLFPIINQTLHSNVEVHVMGSSSKKGSAEKDLISKPTAEA